MDHTHNHAQEEELAFWQTPGAELGEQLKQLIYAKYIGINFIHDGSSPYVIDKTGLDILDVGGGPVSLLLKTIAKEKVVVDPCNFDQWVRDRYTKNTIRYVRGEAEDMKYTGKFDIVLMYNVLQHTSDPAKIFANIYKALKKGGTFHFLDWIDTPTNVAHPISLTFDEVYDFILKAGFKSPTLVHTNINENNAVGTIVYGVFT